MLLNADVKSLEIFVAADLSDDKVMKQELLEKMDMHSLNQAKFKLPDRVTAKRFIFKLLYGATAYGYSVDSDFISVGYSQKQWQKVIDEFYTKYVGIYKWHNKIIKQAMEHGYLEIPSGRYYNFRPKFNGREYKWPLTTIKNYPVQGFGADLVKLARIEAFQQLKRSNLEGEFICTVHDSLVLDVPDNLCYTISLMLKNAIEATPRLCAEHYNYNFSLPIWCEIATGPNKKDMTEITV